MTVPENKPSNNKSESIQGGFGVQDKVKLIEENNNGVQTSAAIDQLKSDLAIQETKMHGMRDIETIKEERKDDDKMHLVILIFYALAYYRR